MYGKRGLRTKEDGGMSSSIMRNPTDPEAIFRGKARKEHRGYAANLEESVGKAGSVVTDYQYAQNNHSDSQFIQEHLKRMEKQEERTVIITDGAYSGTGNTQLAGEKGQESSGVRRVTHRKAAPIRSRAANAPFPFRRNSVPTALTGSGANRRSISVLPKS